jgi:hypothetical protein
MWKEEAHWIGDQINSLGLPDRGVECLNIGSSTKQYRESTKPYIHEQVIKPITRRGRVTHLDAKPDSGVDICGDLSDPFFRQQLAKNKYSVILCNNVLTHVRDPRDVFEIIRQCLAEDGYVIISAPSQYPYCADPYDSKYRPSRADIETMLPMMETIRFATFESVDTQRKRLAGNKRLLLSFIANILFPRRGLRVWKNTVIDLPQLNKKFVTNALVMRRKRIHTEP